MTFRQMTRDELAAWYDTELTTAFIPQECKPLEKIFNLIAEERYEVWGLFEGDTLLGYACLWKAPQLSLVLLDYLGVTAARRSEGLGSGILRRLQQQGRPLVTESELPVADDTAEANKIRLRRIAFYKRCGFTPAYPMATCGMAWQALTYAPQLPIQDIMEQHRALYGAERTDVVVPLPEGAAPPPSFWG